MTERVPILSDNQLEGIEWGEFQKPKAIITKIQHDYGWTSVVDLTFEGKLYRITLNTMHLDLDEAEVACQNVPGWWDVSKNTGALYSILGEEI